VSKYIDSDNVAIRKAYDKLRQWMIKVLRAIYSPIAEDGIDDYHNSLRLLLEQVEVVLHRGHLDVEELIREEKISTEMMSSLINDQDHVYDLTTRLIAVAEILYVHSDPLHLFQEADVKLAS